MNFDRHWLRTSLRVLLLFVALFALWLGFTVHRAYQTKKAIETIEQLGGHIVYDHQIDSIGNYDVGAERPGPDWLRELIGDEYFIDVVRILFYKSDISDN